MQKKGTLGLAIACAVGLAAGMAHAEERYASIGVSREAKPFTLTDKVLSLKEVDFVRTEELDFGAAMMESDRNVALGMPLRFAIPTASEWTTENAGTWENIGEGMLLWRLRVASPDALSLNLAFTDFYLPPGATLTLLTPDGKEVMRPLTFDDNRVTRQYWTPVLNSDEVVVELVIHEKRVPELRLEIGRVNAGFRRFGVPQDEGVGERGTSGSCNVDVACPEGDPWRDEIAASGAYTIGGIDTCSGSMINNTAQDRTPYFLTAFHCGASAGSAPSMVIYWNFENSYCRIPGSPDSGGPGDGSLAQFSSGAIFRAGASVSDFTLVELVSPPDPAWGVTFAGWSREGINPDSGVCINHPQVAEKRITFYSDTSGGSHAHSHGSSWPCTAAPGPGDNTHIRVYWSLGTTEPGSSGSPLYDENHRIIGQLHGGPASCSATGANRSDCYGRFSRSWTGNGSASSRLSDWLDPLNTGALVLDTLGAGMGVSPGDNPTHLGVLGGPFIPSAVVYTLDNPTPDPLDYVVSFAPGGTAPLTLDGGPGPVMGTLGANSTVDVTVAVDASANALPAGVYTTTVQFEDVTSGVTLNRIHTIDAGTTGFTTSPATGLLAGGPSGGPFSGTIVYTITSTKPTPVNVEVAASASWISINGGAGPVNIQLNGLGDWALVTIGFSSDANSLGNGIHNGTVTFTNLDGGDGDTSRPVTLDVGRYTYTYPGPAIPIPDATPSGITSTINVTDQFCVGDVDVEVDITHTFQGDLIVELVSPDGTVVRLHNRTGGTIDNIQVTYDDEGFPPSGPGQLSDFDGAPALGLWTLRVQDHAGIDLGSLNSWKLKIAAAGSVCPPTANDVVVTVPDTISSPIMLDAVSTTGASLTYTILSLPTSGQLTDPNAGAINSVPYTVAAGGDVVNYQPNSLYVGPDQFTYSANDGQNSNVATVDISVGLPQVVYDFPMDTNPGWTTDTGWAFGVPSGSGGDPSSGYTGSNVYGYNLNGAYTSNMPRRYLTTTAMDLSDKINTHLEFRRWLGVEQATYDHAGIEVSNNGSTWVEIWHNPAGSGLSINDNSWQFQSFDISAIADNQPTVYVRWFLGATDGSVQYAGWNIDDVQIKAVTPPAPPTNCAGDANNDLVVDFDDISSTIANWGASYTPGSDGLGDSNDDGSVDFDDISATIAAWGQPC